MTTSDDYHRLIEDLGFLSDIGDPISIRCLSAIALLNTGWRHGDPDPVEDGDEDGGGAA